MKVLLCLILVQYSLNAYCIRILRNFDGIRTPVTLNCIGRSKKPGICTEISKCESNNRRTKCGNLELPEGETIVCCNDINEYQKSENYAVVFPDTKLTISQIKCNEYVSNLKRITKIFELTEGSEFDCNYGICYQSTKIAVVGGSDASLDEFPHMALLGWERAESDEIVWNCGGTLISENFVLTAGHCMFRDDPSYKTLEPTIVRLGDSNPIQVKISSITIHPEYKPPLKYNDICLIRLKTSVKFYQDIRPACLSSETNVRGSATMIGWGAINNEGTRPQRLQKVRLNIYNKTTCEKFYGTLRTLPRGVDDTQFCAGSLQGGKDACQGDSGGPIQIINKQDRGVFDVIGIVSFGRECGNKNGGVYTKIAPYIEWIESIVWA